MNTGTGAFRQSISGIIRPNRRWISEYRSLLSDVREGKLIKLRNGLYADLNALTSSMVDIDAIIPDGILCLYSAWYHYRLSTQAPNAYYVAVERSRRLTLPSFPDIKLVYQNADLLSIGQVRVIVDGIEVLMTDLERSVCDAVKYRNKIGIDIMVEIIDSYLRKPERNLSRLTEHAKKLRVYNTLHLILQVKI